jgi:hypothetical protein
MLLPLKLGYKTTPKDADAVETTVALIRHAVNSKYPSGVPRTEIRLWARIEDEFDTKPPAVEISLEQWKFVSTACREANWPSQWSRLVVVLLDSLDETERGL